MAVLFQAITLYWGIQRITFPLTLSRLQNLELENEDLRPRRPGGICHSYRSSLLLQTGSTWWWRLQGAMCRWHHGDSLLRYAEV